MCKRAAGGLGIAALWVGRLALFLALGCGPRYGDVTGSVTYKGSPVAGGTITFYDAANRATSGAIQEDGTYTVSKVALGRARVTVVSPMDIPFKGMNEGAKMEKVAPKAPPVPIKYADAGQSGLTCEVTS